MGNDSFVSVFTVMALNATMNQRIILFCVTLLCYCAILLVTGALIMTIVLDKSLHEPMYILICIFFMNGLYGSTGFYPHFLSYVLSPVYVVSYLGCLIQAVVLQSFVCSDLAILAVMAYDRYVAICRPLQYHSIMTKQKTLSLICLSSITSICVVSVNIILTSRLKLCSSHLNRFYCVNWLIVKLACPTSDTTANSIVAYCIIIFYTFHGIFILGSYTHLLKTCMNNLESRKKFLETCVPHVVSLLTFIVTVLFDVLHIRFGSDETPQPLRNFMSLQFLLIPTILNPLIYGLKLTNIRKTISFFLTCRKKL